MRGLSARSVAMMVGESNGVNGRWVGLGLGKDEELVVAEEANRAVCPTKK